MHFSVLLRSEDVSVVQKVYFNTLLYKINTTYYYKPQYYRCFRIVFHFHVYLNGSFACYRLTINLNFKSMHEMTLVFLSITRFHCQTNYCSGNVTWIRNTMTPVRNLYFYLESNLLPFRTKFLGNAFKVTTMTTYFQLP
jgi:hypothetical protein